MFSGNPNGLEAPVLGDQTAQNANSVNPTIFVSPEGYAALQKQTIFVTPTGYATQGNSTQRSVAQDANAAPAMQWGQPSSQSNLTSPPASSAATDVTSTETCTESLANNHSDFMSAARLVTQPAELLCAGCCAIICCCISLCPDERPATRSDVRREINRSQIAERQGQTLQEYETEQAAETGAVCGAAVVRCVVTPLSCVVGMFAAGFRSLCSSNTPRAAGAFGYSRDELNNTPGICEAPKMR